MLASYIYIASSIIMEEFYIVKDQKTTKNDTLRKTAHYQNSKINKNQNWFVPMSDELIYMGVVLLDQLL